MRSHGQEHATEGGKGAVTASTIFGPMRIRGALSAGASRLRSRVVDQQPPAQAEPGEPEPAAAEPFSGQTIVVDYPVVPRPRYGHGSPPHPRLYEILNRNRDDYAELLTGFLDFQPDFAEIPLHAGSDPMTPYWINGWLPALDTIALYALVVRTNPRHYFEIGSGNSTKFVRRAIERHGLRTTIISVDPVPRAECDVLCDEVVRQPLEDVDPQFFQRVTPGDIVFIDASHRSFTNSDTTAFFLDVLPTLPDETLVQIHDIYLPDDYPPQWNDRYYNEQYLLATWLLAGGHEYAVALPNYFVATDRALHSILDPLWSDPALAGVEQHGGSFWLRRTAAPAG